MFEEEVSPPRKRDLTSTLENVECADVVVVVEADVDVDVDADEADGVGFEVGTVVFVTSTVPKFCKGLGSAFVAGGV